MNEWWEGLEDRERRLVAIGGSVVALTLLFLGVIEPLQKSLAAAESQYSAQAQAYQSLESIAAKAGALRAQQVASGTLPAELTLERAVDETAQAASLRSSIASMTPERNALKVLMNDAPLAATLNWLVTLRQQYGIRVVEIESTRGAVPGSSNLAITLAAGR
jgi:general secretion pathway protein M